LIRFLTAGESHGPGLTGIIEGLPAGRYIDIGKIDEELARRQRVPGRGGRMDIESDRVRVLSGLRGGYTLGSPLTLSIDNKDHVNWKAQMDAVHGATDNPVTAPRPGHADFPGAVKYGFADIRNVLERASARETAMRTALGAVAKQLLAHWGIEIYSRVLALGPLALDGATSELALWRDRVRQPYGVGDKELQRQADELIAQCRREGVSVGGVFEVAAFNVPVGWGSYVHWDRRLDAQIAGALMSIPGIKGVEFGQAFALAVSPPGTAGDELAWDKERGVHYVGNVNAGLAGGTTTGQPILARCAVKPVPTLMPGLTVDLRSKKVTAPLAERSDTTMVPAAAVVAEHVLALTLLVAGHSAPDRY